MMRGLLLAFGAVSLVTARRAQVHRSEQAVGSAVGLEAHAAQPPGRAAAAFLTTLAFFLDPVDSWGAGLRHPEACPSCHAGSGCSFALEHLRPQSALSERVDSDGTHYLGPEDLYYLHQVEAVNHEDVFANYDVLEELGEGGTSKVYRAQRKEDAMPWSAQFPDQIALKVIDRREFAADKDRSDWKAGQIMCEINYAKRFESLGLKIYFVAINKDKVALGFELAEQMPNLQLTFQHYPLRERMRDLLTIATHIAALEAEGVVHNDIKPQNIMRNSEGEPMLLDFGVATVRGYWVPGLGTPAYMAPEAHFGEYWSDAWALGLMCYYMIFEGSGLAAGELAVKDNFPPGWVKLEEDPLVNLLQQRTSEDPDGEDYVKKMEAAQELFWIRNVLDLLHGLLHPHKMERMVVRTAVRRLDMLLQHLDQVGPEEVQHRIDAYVREIQPVIQKTVWKQQNKQWAPWAGKK